MQLKNVPSLNEFNFPVINEDEIILLENAIDKTKLNVERYKIGYSDFDKAMKGGLKEGDLMVISGVSGQGKTTLAQSITYNLCKDGISCLWFSYEVSLEHLHGKFIDMDIQSFYSVYVPKKNTTGKLEWIKSKIKEGKIKTDAKVVFIDHIDFLIPSEITNSDNQSVALKKITTELKSLAIELNVAVILMAHLKKLDSDREPDMQDIGYSAGVFQLPDYVVLVSREKNKKNVFEKTNENVYSNESIIKYVKNRETGELPRKSFMLIKQKFVKLITAYENT